MTQYETMFADLARHKVLLVPTKRGKIRRFINGLNYGLRFSIAQKVATDARFDQVVEIDKCLEMVCRKVSEEREAKRPHSPGCFNSASSRGQFHYSKGCPSRPV